MNYLELFIGCIIIWIFNYFSGKTLFNEKTKHKIPVLVIIITCFAALLALINIVKIEDYNGVLKIIASYSVICMYFKIVFKKKITTSFIAGLIVYLVLFASEALVVVGASIICKWLHVDTLFLMKDSIIMNFLITGTDFLLIYLNRKSFTKLMRNSKIDGKGSIMIIVTVLVTLALLVFKIPINDWNFSFEFVITMTLLFCFSLIGIIILKQRAEIQIKTSMYQQLAEYSDITNNVLEEYRVVTHESKNQLLVISTMVNKSNKELIAYVDNLLDKRKTIKYEWIAELNYIPVSGLRGLINYKILEMESSGINTNIYISKEISKTDINKLTIKQKDSLYSIMGIYLDNAMQASQQSEEKEVSIEMYLEKGNIIIVIANTYAETIDLDKLDSYGYTTKGKNHGVGLHIVREIIQQEKIFSSTKSIKENYFIQTLEIKGHNKKERKKQTS